MGAEDAGPQPRARSRVRGGTDETEADPRTTGAGAEDIAAATPTRRTRSAESRPRTPTTGTRRAQEVGGEAVVAGVRISHPERVVYASEGITKLDVARYYVEVAPHLLPYVRHRPLSLVRCPQGSAQACFFQKHATGREIPGIDFVRIVESGGEKPYVLANTARALAGLAQMGTLELHAWNATADDVERADTLVFDFDPDSAVAFAAVAEAALRCRAILAALGLASFAKTTGGKGVHVVVPLSRRVPWATVKKFARGIAEEIERTFPDQYTTKAAKSARKGRIFVDYLRNARGATAVAPYSLRARPGATVAVPLYWNEVGAQLDPAAFNLRTVAARLATDGDPWAGYRTLRQTITVEMQRQLARAR